MPDVLYQLWPYKLGGLLQFGRDEMETWAEANYMG